MTGEAQRVADEMERALDFRVAEEEQSLTNYETGVTALRYLARSAYTNDEVRLSAALKLVELS